MFEHGGLDKGEELRRIQREMVAEWLRLADEIRRPPKSWRIAPLKIRQMQLG